MKKSSIYWCVFDIPAKQAEQNRLEKLAEHPNLWDEPDRAQRIMKKLSSLREEIEHWLSLEQSIHDVIELAQFEDESLRPDLEAETQAIERKSTGVSSMPCCLVRMTMAMHCWRSTPAQAALTRRIGR